METEKDIVNMEKEKVSTIQIWNHWYIAIVSLTGYKANMEKEKDTKQIGKLNRLKLLQTVE